MNQRESSGLPLRAMVMVLLFLGVVFLLVGFQAMGSGSDSSSDDTSVPSALTTTTTTPPPAPAKADVRVFNVSSTEGAAENTANKLRDNGWNVVETGNLSLDGLTATTVYYSNAPGEHEAADAVGKLLQAPVEARSPALAAQGPGVIVAVTG
jgi:hypothetical protein